MLKIAGIGYGHAIAVELAVVFVKQVILDRLCHSQYSLLWGNDR